MEIFSKHLLLEDRADKQVDIKVDHKQDKDRIKAKIKNGMITIVEQISIGMIKMRMVIMLMKLKNLFS